MTLAYEFDLFFDSNTQEKEFFLTIDKTILNVYFNLNKVESDGDVLFMTCRNSDKTTTYFASFRCVVGSYINMIDGGCPYLFTFIPRDKRFNSSITFDVLNSGEVKLYAIRRK